METKLCLCCNKSLENATENELLAQWHKKCIKKFFGTNIMPQLHLDEAALEQLVTDTVAKGFTVAGVQKKLSLHLSDDSDNRLTLVGYPTGYILKPQSKDFEQLPEEVKNELKIMCVLYVHDVGGILTLVYEEDGELCFEVTSEEFDPMFDDIGSQLKIKELQREKQDLLQALQLYYRVFFLGEDVEEEPAEE